MYAFILSLLPNRSDAEDVLQETNLILCQKSKEYDPERAFVLGIQYCQVSSTQSHLTKKKRSKVYFSNELVETLASEEFDAYHQLTQRALQICYELLPDFMREISRLRFKEDLSMKEISKKNPEADRSDIWNSFSYKAESSSMRSHQASPIGGRERIIKISKNCIIL